MDPDNHCYHETYGREANQAANWYYNQGRREYLDVSHAGAEALLVGFVGVILLGIVIAGCGYVIQFVLDIFGTTFGAVL